MSEELPSSMKTRKITWTSYFSAPNFLLNMMRPGQNCGFLSLYWLYSLHLFFPADAKVVFEILDSYAILKPMIILGQYRVIDYEL